MFSSFQASDIPPGAELLGWSAKTPIEIFSVDDVALGFQGHPEFNLDVLTDLIEDRRAKGILTVRTRISSGQKSWHFFQGRTMVGAFAHGAVFLI